MAKKSARIEADDGPDSVGLDVLVSINQASYVFERDRATVTKRIAALGIAPAGKRRGHSIYSMRALRRMDLLDDEGQQDPDKMTPFERAAHYKAEAERMRVDQERRLLLRRENVEGEFARVLRVIAQELDTLVDEVERDVGASQMVLEKLEDKIDVIRQRMADGIYSGHNENGS